MAAATQGTALVWYNSADSDLLRALWSGKYNSGDLMLDWALPKPFLNSHKHHVVCCVWFHRHMFLPGLDVTFATKECWPVNMELESKKWALQFCILQPECAHPSTRRAIVWFNASSIRVSAGYIYTYVVVKEKFWYSASGIQMVCQLNVAKYFFTNAW